jgi:hypothetical protein
MNIDDLETEKAMLAEQCESQVSTIASFEKENELKECDEEKKEEESKARLINLEAQHEQLTSEYSVRETTITAIQDENLSMKSRIKALERDKERLDKNLQQQ